MASSKRPFTVITIDDSSDDEADPPRRTKALWRNGRISASTHLENHVKPLDLERGPAEMIDLDQPVHRYKRRRTSPSVAPLKAEDAVAAQDMVAMPETKASPVLSEQDCLDRVLELFPDVGHGHVLSLLQANGNSVASTIDQLLEAPSYPKEAEISATKQRAKQAAQDAKNKPKLILDAPVVGEARKTIVDILKNEFPKIPVNFIQTTQVQKHSLYATYIALNEAQRLDPLPYGRTRWRQLCDPNWIQLRYSFKDHGLLAQFMEQFNTARKECNESNARRRKEAALKKQEQQNEEEARAAGALAECSVCFGDSPYNRVVECNQDPAHPTCFECMTTFIKTEVGQSSCKIACPDSSGCSGTFTERQLRTVPIEESLLDQLLHLQQERALRDAGVDDIETCPLCEYKTVCPPIEEDFEFRCQASECGITTCRKCRSHTHIPDTCAEAKAKRSKDAALDLRHTLEEEMSKALIRACNKCKKPFIKSDGCNKMTCMNCGHHQCYICSESIEGYQHFAKRRSNGTMCPQFDGVESVDVRHAREVKEAEAAARAKIVAENPEVSKEHLEFKLSETVLQAERAEADRLQAQRLQREGMQAGHIGAQGHRLAGVRGRLGRMQAEVQQRLMHMQPPHAPAPPMPNPLGRHVGRELPPAPPRPIHHQLPGMLPQRWHPPHMPPFPAMPQMPQFPGMPQIPQLPAMHQFPGMPQLHLPPMPNFGPPNLDGMVQNMIRNLNPNPREAGD